MMGLSRGEEHVVVLVGEAVGVLGVGLELHQVHHVDHPHLQLGQVAAEDGDGGQGLQGGVSPQQASTASGSAPWSLEAHCQMPMRECSA